MQCPAEKPGSGTLSWSTKVLTLWPQNKVSLLEFRTHNGGFKKKKHTEDFMTPLIYDCSATSLINATAWSWKHGLPEHHDNPNHDKAVHIKMPVHSLWTSWNKGLASHLYNWKVVGLIGIWELLKVQQWQIVSTGIWSHNLPISSPNILTTDQPTTTPWSWLVLVMGLPWIWKCWDNFILHTTHKPEHHDNPTSTMHI